MTTDTQDTQENQANQDGPEIPAPTEPENPDAADNQVAADAPVMADAPVASSADGADADGAGASDNVAPDLKRIVAAMLFAAKKPLPIAEIRRVINEVGAAQAPEEGFKPVREAEVKAALAAVQTTLAECALGVTLGVAPGASEAGGGYRLQTDPACGPWLRCLLELGKPTRLSRPALETLAIIAYRQPAGRAEIEGVRGVSVDAMLRTLLEMQLIKITGRSELPGRPLLYGTTQLFLEHFGLKHVRELPGIEQLCRREEERARAAAQPPAAPAENDGMMPDQTPELPGFATPDPAAPAPDATTEDKIKPAAADQDDLEAEDDADDEFDADDDADEDVEDVDDDDEDEFDDDEEGDDDDDEDDDEFDDDDDDDDADDDDDDEK